MNRIERLTGIVLLLQQRPATATQIATHFEVSKRTVLRDVQALCEIGVPVVAQPGSGGGYALPAHYRMPALPLTDPEAFLLLFALSTLRSLADTPFAAERAALEAKLQTLLAPAQHAPVAQLLNHVDAAPPTRAQRAPFLDAIIAAARDQQWIAIAYSSARRQSTQTVLPRTVVLEAGYWYCHAYAAEHQAERVYRVDRIQALAPADPALIPSAAPPSVPYDHPAHPEVYVTLTARGVAEAESEPQLGSRIVRAADGSGSLCFRCPPGELSWFARYFAGLGREAQIHAPPELRERLIQHARELLAQYESR